MVKGIRHIGIVVKDLEGASKRLEGFGLRCTEVLERKDAGLTVAFLPAAGASLELLSFAAGGGRDPVHALLRSQEGAINHICFEVDSLQESIRAFESNGAKLVEGCPFEGAHGLVAFFCPETTEGILVELCEVST